MPPPGSSEAIRLTALTFNAPFTWQSELGLNDPVLDPVLQSLVVPLPVVSRNSNRPGIMQLPGSRSEAIA
ncbi:MAG: hypothetical protein ACI8T1_002986 [Verrucomicrobiales bacterium]|jgi:hypothetical protein